MRWIAVTMILALVAAVVVAVDDKPLTLSLGKDDVGKLPAGWKSAKTGKDEGSVWKVVADATAPSKSGLVLAQVAEGAKPLFNLCIADDRTFLNVEVRVAFKAAAGKIDQGGGIVWRYQDADNYYICRMNPLENNFRLYKVVEGKRTQLESDETVKVETGTWHTLKVRQVGKKIECYLDDKLSMTVEDETFARPGKVGLWTKADAVTHFDGFIAQDAGK